MIGDKIAADHFKDEIAPLLKANNRLKLAQYVALNNVREKVKPQCEISYKLFKEEYLYNPMFDISSYPTLNRFKFCLERIHHCVTIFGKWVFGSIFIFALPLTKYNLRYCCINDLKN